MKHFTKSLRLFSFVIGCFFSQVVLPIVVGTKDAANALVLQTFSPTDLRPVAAGFTTMGNANQFIVCRYLASGTLDGSFGTYAPGITVTPIGTNAVANAVGIQTLPGNLQKIVAAGVATVGGANQFALVRYDPQELLIRYLMVA